MDKKYWYAGNYGIEIELTGEQAEAGSHSGDCQYDLECLMELPEIKSQLEKLDQSALKKELKDYGAWNDSELSDHNQNLMRILWIACGDCFDNN